MITDSGIIYKYKMKTNGHNRCGAYRGILPLLCIIFLLLTIYDSRGTSYYSAPVRAEQVVNAWPVRTNLLHKHQLPFTASFLTSENSFRFGGTRPAKLLSVHGTKSVRGHGRWAESFIPDSEQRIFLCWQRWCVLPLLGTAPPCRYYIYALRRILR